MHSRMQEKLEKAVDLVIDTCIKDGILVEILRKYRREVKGTMLIEFNEELHRKSEEKYRQEELEKAREEAIKEGREEGREEAIKEGRTLGKAESVLELLFELGDVPADTRGRILNCQVTDTLRKWLKAASKADTIEEFLKVL